MERKSEGYVKGLVSVIMPMYNCEKYIEITLKSVFSQTYKDIEVVLVDDQSKDKIIKGKRKVKFVLSDYHIQLDNYAFCISSGIQYGY